MRGEFGFTRMRDDHSGLRRDGVNEGLDFEQSFPQSVLIGFTFNVSLFSKAFGASWSQGESPAYLKSERSRRQGLINEADSSTLRQNELAIDVGYSLGSFEVVGLKARRESSDKPSIKSR